MPDMEGDGLTKKQLNELAKKTGLEVCSLLSQCPLRFSNGFGTLISFVALAVSIGFKAAENGQG